MAKRRTKAAESRAQMLARGFINCTACGGFSKPGSMRCQGCRRFLPKGKRVLAVVLAAVIIMASAGTVLALTQETKASPLTSVLEYTPSSASAPIGSTITALFTRDMNRTSVEQSFSISPKVNGTFEWLGTQMVFKPDQPLLNSTTYSVSIGKDTRDASGRPLDSGMFSWSFITEGPSSGRRTIGTGADSFWIDRPATGSSASVTPQHPQWVVDALAGGVVMILDRSTTCYPCVQQASICNNIMADGPEGLVFYDLISGQSEPQASQVFQVYDPNGGMSYIPLTVLVTYAVGPFGQTTIVWHSWEGVVPEPILRSWIADAQAHYSDANGG